ncbi:bifunctional tetrahydrofolate synthase/dihydrofolate synthase [Sulfuriflexus mobilis]|uniref:bifunctional tetrahydrofolate synthase/dihydrofolate synthase n=1 Tax=Sulfuriflexus mobilis TaxID=1811807 RepID=UPI000F817E8B|nr:bifunctional tetrahydrofolate synthase/dihydrofolate synthase [Sulfuriflexus mobilis]
MPSLNADTPLTDWLAWLETLHPTEIELGLERVNAVYQRLCQQRPAQQVITVAGTNGKGSTIAMLESILLNAGYSVGSYTSPHLHHYNERVRVGGIDMSDKSLCRAFERVNRARGDVSLTYFEFGTLAALDLFTRHDLDIVLLEVGLGGRLDAVNIVDPDIAVITSVALDHEAWLGDDREAIGFEKAGIMREGIPVICGDRQPPKSLLQRAAELKVELYCLGKQFDYEVDRETWNWWVDSGHGRLTHIGLPQPALSGRFQLDNAATVLATLQCLLEMPTDRVDIEEGLEHVRLPGRFQLLASAVPCIYDVAHNPHAALALVQSLQAQPVKGHTRLVFGAMADKDIGQIVDALSAVVDRWYLAAPAIPRAAPTRQMTQILREQGISEDAMQCYDSVRLAADAACGEATDDDRVVVCGSFYTVAEALPRHV